jgi:protocatechuate 4,5-dioxygenase alpha chain
MSAYELNRLMYDLREPASRDAIRADMDAYLDRYALEESEKQLVRDGDWQGLVEAGVSVYVLTKIGATLDVSLYEMGASMRGMDMPTFWAFINEQNERNAHYAILP